MDDQRYTQNVKKVKCARCNQIIEYGLPNCPCCGVKFIYPSQPAPSRYVPPTPPKERANISNLGKKPICWYDLVPRLALVFLAFVLLLSLFLPYIAMTKTSVSVLKKIYGSNVTFKEMRYLSLIEHAILVNGDLVNMDGGGIYVFFFVLAMLLAVWILLCGVFSARLWAAIGSLVGNALFLIVFCIQNWDFKDRELVPDIYRWSAAYYLILISLIFIFLLASWQIFARTAIWKKCLQRLTGERHGEIDACYDFEPWQAKASNDSWSAQTVNDDIQTVKFEEPHLQIKREGRVNPRLVVDPQSAQRMNTDSQVKRSNTEGAHRMLPKDEEEVTITRIKQYKKMLDDGFITEEEYQAKKRKLLDI